MSSGLQQLVDLLADANILDEFFQNLESTYKSKQPYNPEN